MRIIGCFFSPCISQTAGLQHPCHSGSRGPDLSAKRKCTSAQICGGPRPQIWSITHCDSLHLCQKGRPVLQTQSVKSWHNCSRCLAVFRKLRLWLMDFEINRLLSPASKHPMHCNLRCWTQASSAATSPVSELTWLKHACLLKPDSSWHH